MFFGAVLVFLVRLLAIYLGSWLGCVSTATQREHGQLFWLSMVTQAGVAMGLARLAGTRFPDWGPHFQTYMVHEGGGRRGGGGEGGRWLSITWTQAPCMHACGRSTTWPHRAAAALGMKYGVAWGAPHPGAPHLPPPLACMRHGAGGLGARLQASHKRSVRQCTHASYSSVYTRI